ncbi:MAG: maltose alpha-D-glucosyltransferase [Candidatus Nanopelagicales bacterium]
MTRPWRAADHDHEPERTGPASADNPFYVDWLVTESMLHDAVETGRQLSGQGAMWQASFARPDPRSALQTAAVWFTAYPASLIGPEGSTFLATLADPELWSAFAAIGVQAVHTGPVKRAGGLDGWESTPSVDGHFDRVSTHVDPVFGTSEQYRILCAVAAAHNGTVIDDVVPAHTGKGADFRLAEMGYGDYPGIYHMVQIDPQDWDLLPEVPEDRDTVNLDIVSERALTDAGYIVGPLQRVLFAAPGIKETNWSATGEVLGVDGVVRRWVYLHYFKDGQPSINWIDPSFAGPRLVLGDALQSLTDLGSGGLRLDANGFLGIERRSGSTAWSEGHPLAAAANHLLASTVRKVGGFTFQELNLSMNAIKEVADTGPDLSYDFVTRPAYHHALLTGDTDFLRLCLREAMTIGIDTGSLVHALQNHDELTYELVHFTDTHSDDRYPFRGRTVTGGELADLVRAELLSALTGPQRPYNLPFTTNGIACTTATVAAAAVGVADLDAITDEDVERIRQAHLLMAAFNALQPGVFALSGWDLTGMLTLPHDSVADLMADADTRWINRGAHDLMGFAPDAARSGTGLPRGRSLYGTLPEQLGDPDSFANRLRGLIALRGRHRIAEATLVEVPEVDSPAVLVLVMRLPDGTTVATALNFATEAVETTVRSESFAVGAEAQDLWTDVPLGVVDGVHGLRLSLAGHEARVLRIGPDASEPRPAR